MAGAKRVCQARELEEGKNNGGRQRNIYLMTLYELNSGRGSLSKRGKKLLSATMERLFWKAMINHDLNERAT